MAKNLSFWICAFFWLVLDQSTKMIVAQNVSLQDLAIWKGVLHLHYLTNSGAAFSLFSNGSSWLKWISFLASLGLILFGIFAKKLQKWEKIGYGCILGGALGNGFDRFSKGAVVDFLDFRLINFPIFNCADVAINVGLIFLLIGWLRISRTVKN